MKVYQFKEIDSTNKYLKDNYSIAENLIFVCSDYQTNGKGREDRTWVSNKDENLLFSFILKENLDLFPYISTTIACIVADYLESLGLQNVSIKWPNDVYVNDKKICGILLEGDINKYIVIGVGLNVNQSLFDNNLRHPATSIFLETNKKQNLLEIKNALFIKIYEFYIDFRKYYQSYLAYLIRRDFLRNKTVKYNNDTYYCLGINLDNSLSLMNEKGIISITSGEVTL